MGDAMEIGVHKVGMAAPNDVSELERLIASGTVDPAAIVALIGKTEGNGGANDFTRGYATLSVQLMLAKHLGCTPEEVGRRVAFVWSGGCEGVLSPHATVFTRTHATARAGGGKRLALGIAETRAFAPEEIGTMAVVGGRGGGRPARQAGCRHRRPRRRPLRAGEGAAADPRAA